MKRNDVELYYISKQIKRLQKGIESTTIAIITLLVGFLGNIVSLVLTLLKDEIDNRLYIALNIAVIIFFVSIIIVFIVKIIKNKNKPVVDLDCYDWCTKFDEYIVPNTKCAIENFEILSEIEAKSGIDTTQYRLYSSETAYHLSCSAKELKGMIKSCPEIVDKWITKERILTIIDLLKEMSVKLDKEKHQSFFKDLEHCENYFLPKKDISVKKGENT